MIFINQIREKIGVMFGSPETTPGGRALKFYCSCRIDVRRIGQLKDGEEVVGQRVRAKVVKNKVAPPFRVAEFDMMHTNGISYEGDILDLGLEQKVVTRSGAWFKYGETYLGQGKEKARAFLQGESRKSPPSFAKRSSPAARSPAAWPANRLRRRRSRLAPSFICSTASGRRRHAGNDGRNGAKPVKLTMRV